MMDLLSAGLLPEWQNAPAHVSGPGQDCTGWQRDDQTLRVSVIEKKFI